MKEVNLEEIQRKFQHGLSDKQWNESKDSFPYPDMRTAMKEACKQTLELAADNAEVIQHEVAESIHGGPGYTYYNIDKQSILNTIEQVKL